MGGSKGSKNKVACKGESSGHAQHEFSIAKWCFSIFRKID